MKANTPTALASIQALNFMACRLLTFKRVLKDELCELTEAKFNLPSASPLVELLIEEKTIEDRLGVLTVTNATLLKRFTMGHLAEQGMREVALAA